MRSRGVDSLGRALRLLHRIEDGFLALLLSGMVLLAFAQIVLRNLFGMSLAWGDPLLRLGVLWVGLLGALAASRGNRHIAIDVLSHALPERAQHLVRGLTGLFTAGIAGLVAYYGGSFVATEFEYGTVAFQGVPAWTCEAIVPFAFGMIAVRYLLGSAVSLRSLRAGRSSVP